VDGTVSNSTPSTADGWLLNVTTFAGQCGNGGTTVDGNALTTAKFNYPIGVAQHPHTDAVYVSQSNDANKLRRVRPWDPSTQRYVTTITLTLNPTSLQNIMFHPTEPFLLFLADYTTTRVLVLHSNDTTGSNASETALVGTGTVGVRSPLLLPSGLLVASLNTAVSPWFVSYCCYSNYRVDVLRPSHRTTNTPTFVHYSYSDRHRG
ncbi:MAG: hypothetical protein FD118_4242, partial [Rhodocyclaceae bacterium]